MIEFKLTQKQEAFCCAYIETGNASEAYRRSYDASTAMPSTINRRAKELMDNPKIAARLKELRQPAVDKAQITLESHLAELASLRDEARAARNFSAAISAEVARGKAASLYADRLEVEHKMTLEDLITAATQRRLDDLPPMPASDDPNERRRAVSRDAAERHSAGAPCPATVGGDY